MRSAPDSRTTGLFDRYLALLGLRRRKPGLGALREIVRAHVTRIPFENISKVLHKAHLGLRNLPDLALYLEGIERFRFGGTCYANNFHLHELLAELGYRVRLCGADMTQPDVHLVNVVTVDERDFLVDAGYAAPFLDPMPLDLVTDQVIALGRERYGLKPRDAQGRSRMELYRDGILTHAYVVKPEPRGIGEFARPIAESFGNDATFMRALLVARFSPGRSLVVHNLALIASRRTRWTTQHFSAPHDLARAVEERFGIPAPVTREAVDLLGELKDVWG